ncbi:multidrug efflux RND transporter permease subunit [Ensifer adhaerens]|uniref:multidrug efflux RND transporter permease subunit n=1 Tax=Ensifer adhaerens TaxID=106592 RepID=UPI001CC0D0D9|nr:multidrug efflux RND transporter permease subunit [Ensifer adhaerens]MBZ7927747.1 multidrug efflux RND transporter permease subunit [Ensifer adhaerens]UAX96613.1 multidrug efflux RND transporter permease subunit [Ensifer adhaerens]UAY04043.1 multidrug efflux RND transporter permease subunit [Ensifer adhaerens]UAY12029.1 multidrug efflux RND transporter permease subunit [Ensifer adhaerens]
MSTYFINRPILAWVIAIFIALSGLIAMPFLPVSQYPKVAPPQLTVTANYPGASPADLYQGVTRLIEEELSDVDGLQYFESTSDTSGQLSITVTLETGTNIKLATVDVQNAIRRIESRLPQAVVQHGILVEEASVGFLMFVALNSTDGKRDQVALGDYLSRNVLSELRRIDGVGRAQLFSAQRAMRVWIDPDKMVGYDITAADINSAIAAQNSQVAAGQIGAAPNPGTQELTATVLVQGQLTDPEEFGEIVLRANTDGSNVLLKDVARIEVGAEDYNITSTLNGQPAAHVGIQLSSTGNAVAVSRAIKKKMQELSAFFPDGISYTIPYDTSPFVTASIEKVVHTLIEAVVLVFIVMFVFLQNFRYTLVPTIVVPIALLGTCSVMLVTGFSINVLTMFAMVLAIGILVDDAIVVVENVQRIMAEEGLSPREATIKAMRQITGAIVGVTLVLSCVFVPMAFFPGSVGVIYQQFSITMVVSILISAFLALSLTPAFCATFLKPIEVHHINRKGIAGWFNRKFEYVTDSYTGAAQAMARRAGRMMLLYLALIGGLGYLYLNVPSAFVPEEDQGYLIVDVRAPSDASRNRTLGSLAQIEAFFKEEPGVANVVAIQGFSFSGNGANAAIMFVTLKDWADRGAGNSAQDISNRINGKLSTLQDAVSFALSPPPIEGLGTSSGFTFRLQDRANLGQVALQQAAGQLMSAASQTGRIVGIRPEGMPFAPQVILTVDRKKANTFGVSFADINNTITANLGSAYINDFPNAGRMQRVVVQGQDVDRLQTEDVLKLNVRNASGGMVPISSFASVEWRVGASQIVGYNGYPSVRLSGSPAPGFTSGDAIAEIQRLAAELPKGFGYEWTGISREELTSGAQAPILFALSIVLVFLLLAALYESWSIPLAVILVVPLGVVGSVLAVVVRDLSNDIYFKVGLIAIIGLSAKNAILIVEFAKDYYAEGRGLLDSAIEAARVRFRPIIMTSFAFALGVVPLAVATGPSSASQNAIGSGVLGGMISATVLAVFFVPVFFVFILGVLHRRRKSSMEVTPEATSPNTPTVPQ